MFAHAASLKRKLDKAVGPGRRANFIVMGDLNTMGLSAEWWLIGGLAALAIGLGLCGFNAYFASHCIAHRFTDILYATLQLFTLEVGDLRHPLPWALEVARFLAPFLVAYAATKAILAIFHEQAAMVRMRFFRRHAVVCGLGEIGRLLATSLHEAGHRVVAVELNPDNT